MTLQRKLSRRTTTHIFISENAIKIVSGNPDRKDIKFWSQGYKWGWGSPPLPEEHTICKEAPSKEWEGDERHQYQGNEFTPCGCQGLQCPGKPNPRPPGSYNSISLLTLSNFQGTHALSNKVKTKSKIKVQVQVEATSPFKLPNVPGLHSFP